MGTYDEMVEFVKDNLMELCAEYIEFQKTAIIPDNTLLSRLRDSLSNLTNGGALILIGSMIGDEAIRTLLEKFSD
jgi:hypothetical protein